MTQEHIDQLHRTLSEVPHLYEVCRVVTFKAYWRDDDEITLHIEDLGPNAPQDQRYRCIAKPAETRSGETRIAASNPTSDPVMAVISMLPHWQKLDRKP